MGQLSGKVAIVTGAGRGIGRDIALAFAREGAKVAVVSRTTATVDAVVNEIKAEGGEAIGVTCDVSHRDQVLAAVDATVKAYGTVHVLVNNAHDTTTMTAMMADVTEEQMLKQLSSGLFSTVNFMQACLPYLKQNQGSVINFASGAGLRGAISFGPYAAAKEAIRGVSRVAAREWGPDKINVNIICPCSMTEALEESMKDPTVQAALSDVPLGIPGRPMDEIAPVALFLATDASRYITGHSFLVDGGNLMDAGR